MGTRFLLAAAALLVVATTLLQGSAPASHSPSHPCDFVASTAGSNANPGTVEQPFATVQKLVNSLQPGQTGCLRGTAADTPFRQNVTVSNKNGTSEAGRITIKSYPGEIAKLRGRLFIADTANYITFSKLVLDGRDAVSNPPTLTSPRIDGDFVSFEDNNVTSAGAVPCFRFGISGFVAYSPRLTRNRIHDCRDAVSATESVAAQVTDNLIFDNPGWGLRIGPNGDSSYYYQNILDGNRGGVLFSGDDTNTPTGNTVDSNIVANSTPDPNADSSWSGLNPAPPIWANYLWRSCVYKPPANDGDAGVDNSAGGYTPTQLSDADPGYDSAGNNFHITSSSPCFQYTGDVAARVDAGGGPTDEQASADNTQPNVLFIVTDDQRAEDTVRPQSMPQTIARIRDAGTNYPNGFATTPLCCPGRSSIFSGRYAHNHGVHQNSLTGNLDHSFTLQRYVHDANYKTGIFGKFLNAWDLEQDPPYWDRWAIFNGGHCGWTANEQGELKSYGTPGNQEYCAQGAPYSADYIADQATGSATAPDSGFIDQTEANDSQPWFMYLAPTEPHGAYQPEYEYKDLDVGTIDEGPANSEGQTGGDPITDKPQHIQWMCKQDPSDATCTATDPSSAPITLREKQLRMLRSVDDLIGRVLDDLERHGEQDTIIVFLSDNGFTWGEHGLAPTKNLPYPGSSKVPFMMRYAPFTTPGSSDPSFVANIDLLPTVLDAITPDPQLPAGSPAPDGISLLNPGQERNRVLAEGQHGDGNLSDDGKTCPTPARQQHTNTACGQFEPYEIIPRKWATTVTADYQYTEYYQQDGLTVESREYYPASDSEQLTNVLNDGVPSNDPNVASLHDQLTRDRFCRGAECPGGGGQGPLTDPINPRAVLVSPESNGYTCCRVHLDAMASDNAGIESVQFWVDGASIGPPDTTYPYGTVWNSNSANQGTQVTQHEIKMLVRDSSGNSAFSPLSTVNIDKGLDIQIEDPSMSLETDDTNWNVIQKPSTNDTVTYSFGRTITPSQVVPGWDASQPADCVARPSSCVTVTLINVPPGAALSDTIKVYTNTPDHTELGMLGTIDLLNDGFVGTNGSFTNSKLELVDGGKAIKVTLGNGAVGAYPDIAATSIWRTSSGSGSPCGGCLVYESLDGSDEVADHEF